MDKPVSNDIYRILPSVDSILAHPLLTDKLSKREICLEACRKSIQDLRDEIPKMEKTFSREDFLNMAAIRASKYIELKLKPSLINVINATGVVLHTNLGRAVLSEKAVKAAQNVAE